MTVDRLAGRPHSSDNPAAAVAVALVVLTMAWLSRSLTGPSSGDWLGYAQLYSDQGGWLLDQNRDPGFLLLLNCAHWVFGRYGYIGFRDALSLAFICFAAWLSHSMPRQSKVPQIGSIIIALVVISAFCLKGFVQIREGLAFLFIVGPVVSMFAKGRSGIIVSGLGAVVALSFHSGTVVLAGAWLIAVALMSLSNPFLASRALQKALFVTGLSAGIIIAAFTILHANDVRVLLGSYGVDTHAKLVSSSSKDFYWLVNGAIAWKIRNSAIQSLVGTSRFAFCYGSSIASFAIPAMYAVCVTLVVFGFGTPALTSMMIRLFFTVTELGMILITLKGRGNLTIALTGAFMLADRLRVVGESN